MDKFKSNGLTIAYRDTGQGDPILLIHGFASSSHINWVYPGWVKTLVEDGRRVIAIDNRGHGESDKPRDPAAYPAALMAEDGVRLLDHLGVERADVMGYSMGARITAFMAMAASDRVRSATFGGLGMGMIEGVGASAPIIAALEAPSLENVTDKTGRIFRQFAEATKGDLKALAACMRSTRAKIPAEEIAKLTMPVLVAVGTKDDISGSASGLARLIPGARVLDIPDRDHMLAVGDKVYKSGVLSFLKERP